MQLDIFRGLAALLMILNHSGFAWLSQSDSAESYSGALVFAGGWAPFLFFFATGLGMGWHGGRHDLDQSVWSKAAWLLLADVFLNLGMGVFLGFNFFGFTALSMMVVAVVRSLRQAVRVASFLIVALLFVRYGMNPLLKWLGFMPGWLDFVTGARAVPGVSYPVSPWLVYPLAAWLLAQLRFQPQSQLVIRYATPLLAILGGALASFAALLVWRGLPMFRWGSVSIAYFVQSIAALILCWFIAGFLAKWGAQKVSVLAIQLSLRGPASLLVVPLHYVVVGVGSAIWGHGMDPSIWVFVAPLFGFGVLVLARALSAQLQRFAFLPTRGSAAWIFWITIILAIFVCGGALTGLPLLLITGLGQVLVAWRLSVRASHKLP